MKNYCVRTESGRTVVLHGAKALRDYLEAIEVGEAEPIIGRPRSGVGQPEVGRLLEHRHWRRAPETRQPFDDFLRKLVTAELMLRYQPANETASATPRAWMWPS